MQATNQAAANQKVQRKPLELAYDHQIEVTFQQNKQIKNTFVVLVASTQYLEQLTIHHPIGITDLDNDEWVSTRTANIHYLLSRAEDPQQQKLNAVWQANRSEYLIAMSLLTKKDDKIYYQSDLSRPRVEILDEADHGLKEDRKSHQAEHDEKHAGKPKKPVFKYSRTRDEFLNEVHRKFEKEIRSALNTKEAREFVMRGAPQTYRTRGGPLCNEEQIAIPGLKGLDTRSAQDRFLTLVEGKVAGKQLPARLLAEIAPRGTSRVKLDNNPLPKPAILDKTSEELFKTLLKPLEQLQPEVRKSIAYYLLTGETPTEENTTVKAAAGVTSPKPPTTPAPTAPAAGTGKVATAKAGTT
jgi:hypothetical protein